MGIHKKLLSLALCLSCTMGGDCQSGPSLNCANPLDGSALGFTLSVPEGFACSGVSSLQALLVVSRVNYVQADSGIAISVVVSVPQGDGDGTLEGVTVTDQGSLNNPNGLVFELQKLVFDLDDFGVQTSYSGGIALQSGNNLIVSVTAAQDSMTLPDVLDEVLNTVQFVAQP